MNLAKTLPQRKLLHCKLRARLMELGISQGDIAKLLGISPSHCSHMFTGVRPWDTRMMYQVMDYLDVPYDQLHAFFPPNPLWQGEEKGRRSV